MPNSASPQVFVSYSTKDREAALAIVEQLEAGGILCWIAPRDVPGGEQYAAAIMEGIEQSRMILVLYSHHAAESEHVLREIERADSLKKRLLPVRLEDAVPTGAMGYFLAGLQWVDFRPGRWKTALPEIERETRAILRNGAHQPATLPGELETARPGLATASAPARYQLHRRHIVPIVILLLLLAIGGIALSRRWNSPPSGIRDAVSLLEEGRIFAARKIVQEAVTASPGADEPRALLKTIDIRLARLGPSVAAELEQVDDDFDFRLWIKGDNQTVSINKKIDLWISAEVDCHAFVFSRMSDGEEILLFPNTEHPDNALRAGVATPIPGSPLILRAVDTGIDVIYAIAATDPSSVDRFRSSIDLKPNPKNPYAIFPRERPRAMVIELDTRAKTACRVITVEIVE